MDYKLEYVIDENGNKYVVIQEIKEDNKVYYLTKGGLFTKSADGKYERASAELNEKYMLLLTNPKIDEYVVERKSERTEETDNSI